MKMRTLLGALVFVGAFVVISAQVVSDEKGEGDQAKEQQMQAWMKYAEPGKFHAYLEPFVGRWTQTVKWWMEPNTEPDVSTGTCEYKWILGKRFLQQEVRSDSEEHPFAGMGLIGHDNFKKKYTGMWVDTMTTSIMTSMGTCDDSGKVFTMTGTQDDIFTGMKNQPFRAVSRIVNNDKLTDEMYMTGPDGKEYKALEIVYTRKH
jgi:hypothetical protein